MRLAGGRGSRWHLNDFHVRLDGLQHYRWRAVDHEGPIQSFVTNERDGAAALSFITTGLEHDAVKAAAGAVVATKKL